MAENMEQEIKALKDQLAKQNDQLAQQNLIIQALLKSNGAQVNASPASGSRFDDVTIVHLFNYPEGLGTHIALTNLTIDLTTFGEERTLSMQQFEELVGRYHKLFSEGIIALANQHADLAKRYNVKTENEYKLTRDIVSNLAKIDIPTLTDVFQNSPIGHQRLIAETWKSKIIEKDADYMDLQKVGILNSLTGGSFQYDLNELMNIYGQNKKKK